MKGAEKPIPTDSKLMNVLMGLDADKNPKGVRYLSVPKAKGKTLKTAKSGLLAKDGNAWLRDPWGNPFFVLLDHDDDHTIKDPFGKNPLHGRVSIAWSAGKDGKLDFDNPEAEVNKDNIYSWR